MATIPEIRDRLHELADELRHPLLFPRKLEDIARELHQLADDTRKRPAIRKAPVTSVSVTDELQENIRKDWANHPQFTQQMIAERHGVTAGRVSEAIRGKRT
jgi:ribosomal protein S25